MGVTSLLRTKPRTTAVFCALKDQMHICKKAIWFDFFWYCVYVVVEQQQQKSKKNVLKTCLFLPALSYNSSLSQISKIIELTL